MDSTRIADLPDNTNNIQPPVMMDSTAYAQINIHPNPFGNQPPQQTILSIPEQTQAPPKLNANSFSFPIEPPQEQYSQSMLPNHVQHQEPQFPLPSRDIPMTTEVYTHDEQIQPNYIPPAEHTEYISPESDEDIVKKRTEDRRAHFVDDVYISVQRPIILALIVFLIQMPIVNVLLRRYLPFLHLYGLDGNINMLGITVKSVAFGIFVYGFESLLSYFR